MVDHDKLWDIVADVTWAWSLSTLGICAACDQPCEQTVAARLSDCWHPGALVAMTTHLRRRKSAQSGTFAILYVFLQQFDSILRCGGVTVVSRFWKRPGRQYGACHYTWRVESVACPHAAAASDAVHCPNAARRRTVVRYVVDLSIVFVRFIVEPRRLELVPGRENNILMPKVGILTHARCQNNESLAQHSRRAMKRSDWQRCMNLTSTR